MLGGCVMSIENIALVGAWSNPSTVRDDTFECVVWDGSWVGVIKQSTFSTA